MADWLLPFLLPPGFCLLLGAGAFVLFRLGHRPAARLSLAVAFAVLWVSATPWFARTVAAPLERQNPPVEPAEAPLAEVILVLGGGTSPAHPPRLEPDLGAAADRVWLAARLYAAGRAPRVVVSGGATSAPLEDDLLEADSMQYFLMAWGVPASAIEVEHVSENTWENCLFSAHLVAPAKRILLVTSALHMPRAVALCEEAGFEVIAAATDFQPAEGTTGLDWAPNAPSLALTSAALKERLAAFMTPLLVREKP